jgi:hypothetical protein
VAKMAEVPTVATSEMDTVLTVVYRYLWLQHGARAPECSKQPYIDSLAMLCYVLLDGCSIHLHHRLKLECSKDLLSSKKEHSIALKLVAALEVLPYTQLYVILLCPSSQSGGSNLRTQSSSQ